jgi:hypothetical protein
MFILDTPQVVPSTSLKFDKNAVRVHEQCSDIFLHDLDESVYTDRMRYLNMSEGECLIFGKSLYHMSDFRKQSKRVCLNFRVIIKDPDGGVPVNLDYKCSYNNLFKKRIKKYLRNGKIYLDRYELLNIHDMF